VGSDVVEPESIMRFPFAPLPVRQLYWRLRSHPPSLNGAVGAAQTIGRAAVNRLLGRSDYARWENPASLEAWWETRTAQIARLIPSETRVIEFGAGRCRLPHYLGPSSVYMASDIVPRELPTFVCDLNKRPLPDLSQLKPDVAVFIGVLEYLTELPVIVAWLSTQVTMCVVSYDPVRTRRWTLQRLQERMRRKSFGYMNDYRDRQLVEVFEQAGFSCVRTDQWQTQGLYVMVTRDGLAKATSTGG
jgi:hypothetical protein